MIYVLSHFLFWLVAIFAIGVLTALLTRQGEKNGQISPWLKWSLLAFSVGLLLALLHVMQGRAGVWLETGLAAFASFLLGAGAGALGRSGHLREHKAWALGLIPAALAWFGANLFETPKVEAELKTLVETALKDAGHDRESFALSGRDVALEKETPDRAALVVMLSKIDGVRLVEDFGPLSSAPPMANPAPEGSDAGKTAGERAMEAGKAGAQTAAEPPKGSMKMAGKATDEGESAAAKTTAAERVKATAKESAKPVESEKPLSAAEKIKAAKSALIALPASGALETPACQIALDATQALDKIQFRSGSARIHRASAEVLDRLAGVLQRCAGAKVEIGGHTDNVGDDEDNQALSQRRADTVMRYMVREGVEAARLTAIGYGAKKPIASNDDEEGRTENRRIEFVLK